MNHILKWEASIEDPNFLARFVFLGRVMRLLHTTSLVLHEFFDSQIPEYAILSHRWGKNETTYKEMRKGPLAAPSGPGLDKIIEFCRLASKDSYEWAWIDTCCIDKRSSSELSEAINSMYEWYKAASHCYIHLSDVSWWTASGEYDYHAAPGNYDQAGSKVGFWTARQRRLSRTELETQIRASAWFRRGWTLQELLAPHYSKIHFVDSQWEDIGTLADLATIVSEITCINKKYVCLDRYINPEDLNPWGFSSTLLGVAQFTAGPSTTPPSVAQIMSWASCRETSRGEDMAYCLLGLFGVNMPLLYGEGATRAFYRLQVAIMMKDNDESLFAWTTNSCTVSGMLAPSPEWFADCGDIIRGPVTNRPPYSMTHKGVQIEIPRSLLFVSDLTSGRDISRGAMCTPLIYLNCYRDKGESLEDRAIDENLNYEMQVGPKSWEQFPWTQEPLVLKMEFVWKEGRYCRKDCHKVELDDLSPSCEPYTMGSLFEDLRETTTIHAVDINGY